MKIFCCVVLLSMAALSQAEPGFSDEPHAVAVHLERVLLSTRTADIARKAPKNAPIVRIVEPSATYVAGETVVLTASGVDPDGDDILYGWDLGGLQLAINDRLEIQFDNPGAYNIRLIGSDPTFNTSEVFERWILINPRSIGIEVPAAAFIQSPQMGAMFASNMPIDFAAMAAVDSETTFLWDFDDGRLGQGLALTHNYEARCQETTFPCRYQPQVFARDGAGRFSYVGDAVTIAVFHGPAPPDGIIESPSLTMSGFGALPVVNLEPDQTLTLRGGIVQPTGVGDVLGRWQFVSSTHSFEVEGDSAQVPFATLVASPIWTVTWYPRDAAGREDPIPAGFRLRTPHRANNLAKVRITEPAVDTQVASGLSFSLAAEPAGMDVEYRWQIRDVVQGHVVADIAGTARATVAVSTPGLYAVELTLGTEGQSPFQVDHRYIVVTALADNQPLPTVARLLPIAATTTVALGQKLQFIPLIRNGKGEEIDAPLFWDLGPFGTSMSASPQSIRFEEPGEYRIRAYAGTGHGRWSLAPANWTVHVYANNLPPQVSIVEPVIAADQEARFQRLVALSPGQTLSLTAQGRDLDSPGELTYLWTLNGIPCESCQGADTGPLTFDELGDVTVAVTVVDGEGRHALKSDTRTVRVVADAVPRVQIYQPAPLAPSQASIDNMTTVDLTIEPGQAIDFLGSGSDPNGLPVALQWDFGDLTTPASAIGRRVQGVVFHSETPPGEPITVRLDGRNILGTPAIPVLLRIAVRQLTDADAEPNNTPQNAFPITSGRYSGFTVTAADPLDYFRLQVPEAGRNLALSLVGDEADGLRLRLLLADGDGFQDVPVVQLDRIKSTTLVNVPAGDYLLELRAPLASTLSGKKISNTFIVETRTPQTYLPLLMDDRGLASQFGVVNTTQKDNDLLFTAFDERGMILFELEQSLPPRGRLFRSVGDLFAMAGSPASLKVQDIRWLLIAATRRLVAYTLVNALDDTMALAWEGLQGLNSDLLLPHVPAEASLQQDMFFINGASQSAGVTFHSAHVQPPVMPSEILAKQQIGRGLLTPTISAWGSIEADEGALALAGFQQLSFLSARQQMGGLEMIRDPAANANFSGGDNSLYFVHVGQDTASWCTDWVLLNPTGSDAQFDIIAYDAQGRVKAKRSDHILPAGQKLEENLQDFFAGTDPASINWLKIENLDGGVIGMEMFRVEGGDRLAMIQASDRLSSGLIFPHIDRGTEHFTGFAVLNGHATDHSLTIEAFDDEGVQVACMQTTLAGLSKRVWLYADLEQSLLGTNCPSADSTRQMTYLRVSTDEACLAGFALFGTQNRVADNQDGQLSAMRALQR